MDPSPEPLPGPTIAVLGGTGRFGRPHIEGFLGQGLNVRILARRPRRVAGCFPRAHVMAGSMMALRDVRCAMDGAAAAFLITPVGGNGDIRPELQAARTAIEAAKMARLPHLIYLSLIQPPRPTGIPMLDVKREVEGRIGSSGVPWSSLRTGCYMDIWLAFFPRFMRTGIYLFPIRSGHRFSFTAQQDVARAAAVLLRQGRVLNRPVDVIEPRARTLQDVVTLYRMVTGRRLIPLGRWVLPLVKILRPLLFQWCYPGGASRVGLFDFFNSNDWVGDSRQLIEFFPEFQATTMEAYLKSTL
jgi:uncharacterized protein YbjT (DUF2867 family)